VELSKRELYVSKIMSGKVGFKIDGRTHFISVPESYDRYIAQELYFDTIRDAGFEGVMTEEEVLDMMIDEDLWSYEEQEKMDTLPKRIENLKVSLYESQLKMKIFEATRKTLNSEKERYENLATKKTALSNFSQTGCANTIKLKYLLYTSMKNKKGEHIYDGDDFWEEDHSLIEDIFKTYLSAQIDESIIREIARTEPWRSYWGAAKAEGSIFGVSASEMTAEQRSLVNWSKFYDSIYEHMEAPTDKVIQDDDLLDGWLILQNRKREKERVEKEMDKKIGKNKGAQEVYIMAETTEEAQKVDMLNNVMSKGIKKQRERMIDKHGEIQEQHLPDAKQRMRNQAYAESKQARKR
jgi:hypothetical protein